MTTPTLIFLLLLIGASSVELYLSWRQFRSVSRHRHAVPAPFIGSISLTDHQKAADYTIAKLRSGAITLLYGTLLLLLWTLGGGLEWLDQLWSTSPLSAIWQGVAVMISFSLLGLLLDLPFDLYRTFRLEQRFGFNNTTPTLYLSDMLKQLLLSLLLGIPLLSLVLWLMIESGPLWWLYVWGVWMGFSLLMLWAYPTVIAPLFNRFTPLEDQTLVSRIEQLMQRCGFTANGIFMMDGSKRSRHGNAYFTGLGKSKRIVFFDTLLADLTHDEIEAVLAHELGHFRCHHLPKRLLLTAVMTLAALYLLGWLSAEGWFFTTLGVSTPSAHMALILFMLVMPLLTIFIQPLMAAGMRKHEFEADAFAVRQSDGNRLIDALVKLYQENANTLTPDPWFSNFHDSHPPAPIRIAHIQAQLNP